MESSTTTTTEVQINPRIFSPHFRFGTCPATGAVDTYLHPTCCVTLFFHTKYTPIIITSCPSELACTTINYVNSRGNDPSGVWLALGVSPCASRLVYVCSFSFPSYSSHPLHRPNLVRSLFALWHLRSVITVNELQLPPGPCFGFGGLDQSEIPLRTPVT